MSLKTIGDVTKETGVHPATLRRWETLSLIKPERMSIGGRSVRVYSLAQVDLLKRVKELLDEGFNLQAAFKRAAIVPELERGSTEAESNSARNY